MSRHAVKKSMSALQNFVSQRVNGTGFESTFKNIRVVSGGDGDCCCELKVKHDMLNPRGTLHGGVISSLVDQVSTYALVTTGTGNPGVSIDLNVSFLKPVIADEHILIKATTLKCGKKIAVGSVDIIKKESGCLVAQGRHSKFVGETVEKFDASTIDSHNAS